MCVHIYIDTHPLYTHPYEQYFREKKNISELLGGVTVFCLFVLELFVLLVWQTSRNCKSWRKAERKMKLWGFQLY